MNEYINLNPLGVRRFKIFSSYIEHSSKILQSEEFQRIEWIIEQDRTETIYIFLVGLTKRLAVGERETRDGPVYIILDYHTYNFIRLFQTFNSTLIY